MSEVCIMEVSPRDGLQNEKALVTTADKLALIDRALAAGARRIEVTSFVHPGRVPQMADAEAVCADLPQRGDVSYAGLVLNWRGYERLRATARLNEVGIVVPATDVFGERNQGANVADSVAMAGAIITDAKKRGITAQVTIAVAFGCPFSGEVEVQRVLNIADQLAQYQPQEIALADTIGVGVPAQVTQLFAALAEKLPGLPLRAHFHDTRNTGIANAAAALAAGVATLDASIGGIGGCPFAPNASGNIATEDLVYLLDRSGIEHGLDLEALIAGAGWLEGVLEKSVPSMLLKAGPFQIQKPAEESA
jgi:hydroxymethylglutaryl-CoA lyase